MVAVRANGIMGTIHIRAYGDFNSSGVDKEALNSTNISLFSSIVDDYPSDIEKIVTGSFLPSFSSLPFISFFLVI